MVEKDRTGNGFEDLANAVIIQAVEDYRAAKKALKKEHTRGRRKAVKELEDFFRSPWFGTLTSVDPEYLLRKLGEEK